MPPSGPVTPTLVPSARSTVRRAYGAARHVYGPAPSGAPSGPVASRCPVAGPGYQVTPSGPVASRLAALTGQPAGVGLLSRALPAKPANGHLPRSLANLVCRAKSAGRTLIARDSKSCLLVLLVDNEMPYNGSRTTKPTYTSGVGQSNPSQEASHEPS